MRELFEILRRLKGIDAKIDETTGAANRLSETIGGGADE